MRDLTPPSRVVPRCVAKGLAFKITDLLLVDSWAAFHGAAMSIHLDHGAEDKEYEEVIAFRTEIGSLCRLPDNVNPGHAALRHRPQRVIRPLDAQRGWAEAAASHRRRWPAWGSPKPELGRSYRP